MKKLFLLTALFQITTILVLQAHAQTKGKIVAVHPDIGLLLERTERDQYGFFPEFPTFRSAVFFLMPDSSYRVQINYIENHRLNRKR